MGYFSKTAQPGTAQHLAERCTDDGCQRLPCRMFKAGYDTGFEDGAAAAYGMAYAAGFAAGQANCGHSG
jgi:hypothetical protein